MKQNGRRVVIVGGGFAGLHLAKKLSNTDFNVVLIDKENHHMFQPLFYQVASARLEPSNISFPFRKIFQKSKNIEIKLAEVKKILPLENKITTSEHDVNYDILILATGCKTNFFGNTVLSSFAFSMKTSEEAIAIRNNVLLSFEKLAWANPEEKKALLNIVIVGAGPTGVELAGAFAEMKKNILPRDYPQLDFSALRVILIEGSNHTLNSMSETAKKASEKYLRDMGVELMLNNIVSGYDGEVLRLQSGLEIPTKNLIWAAGVIGNTIEGISSEVFIRNRYVVDRQNKIKSYDNIYALGDIAYMETPLYPNAHPQLANVAINQAKTLGDNLLAGLKGKQQKDYEYKDLGSMATVGKRKAVVDLPTFKFHGRIAWFVWMFLHLMLILSVKNKLKIFINWAWHYFTNDSSLRLVFRIDKK